MNLGWIAEIPTHQVQNFWQERVEEQLQYVQRSGVEAWSTLVIYLDDALVMGSDGVLYQSQQATNTAHTPIGDDGTWWIVYGRLPLLARSEFSGFLISNNVTSPNDDLDISPGVCRDADDTGGIELVASITKQLDNVWVEGSNQGGRASSILTVAANTDYLLFAIGKADGTADIGMDTDPAATNLLTDATGDGYTRYQQIGFASTDSAGDLRLIYHSANDPDYIRFTNPITDYDGVQWPTATVSRVSSAPPGTKAFMNHYVKWDGGSSSPYYVMISPLSVVDVEPTAASHTLRTTREDEHDRTDNVGISVDLDGSSQWRWRCDTAISTNGSLTISTIGYRFKRGAQ